MEEKEAKMIIEQCFKVLFYRHARTNDKIQMCVINKDGVKIEDSIQLETK